MSCCAAKRLQLGGGVAVGNLCSATAIGARHRVSEMPLTGARQSGRPITMAPRWRLRPRIERR